MMRFNIILVVLAAVMLTLMLWKQSVVFSWIASFYHTDADPYGSSLVHEWLELEYDVTPVVGDTTISQATAKLDTNTLLVFVTDDFFPLEQDEYSLLRYVRAGGDVLIAAEHMSDLLEDSLEIKVFFEGSSEIFRSSDSTLMSKDTRVGFASQSFLYNRKSLDSSFEFVEDDTTEDFTEDNQWYTDEYHADKQGPWKPLLHSYDGMRAATRRYGKGSITYTSIPILFTNYGLLYDSLMLATDVVADSSMKSAVYWDSFYKPVKPEQRILNKGFTINNGLRYGYYLSLFMAGVFLVVQIRRRQRIIPIVEPPINTTMEYVKNLSMLYHNNNTTHNVALRTLAQFEDHVQRATGYRLSDEKMWSIDQLAVALGTTTDILSSVLRHRETLTQGNELSAHDFKTFIREIHSIQYKASNE